MSKLLTDHVDLSYLESIGISVSDLAGDVAGNVDITELVRRATANDSKSIRNANYLFETIGEEAAETLAEVFRHEGNTMPEAEWQAAIEAAKVTINEQAMPLLLESKLDAHHFARALQRVKSTQPLSAEQEAIYTRILGTSAQVIFAVADSVPHFTRDTTAMLLQNVESLSQRMRTALATQERILAETYGEKIASLGQQFESEYRTLIGSSLNKLELFGVDNFDGARQPLSVAYVRLMVELRRRASARNDGKEFLIRQTVMQEQPLAVEDALSIGNRLLIVSDAGSGKTTLLKWVAVQAAGLAFDAPLTHWRGYVPFFVRLRDFAHHPLPEYGTLASSLRELKPLAASVPDHWAEERMREGRALVLLDGMDEVSNEKRQEALTWIENLLLLYPDNVVIVSSRPSGLNDLNILRNFRQMAFGQIRLLPMDNDQVTRFIQQWHEAMGSEYCRYSDKALLPEKCNGLLTTLGNREELQNLAKSPILCAMLCALNLFELGILPQDRIRLYDRCIDILLRRDLNRQVDSSNYTAHLRPARVQRLLARIAYWMMKSNSSLIQKKDVTKLLAQQGLDVLPVLEFLSERSVIFRQQSDTEFDFIHRTFVEYLAGQEIVRAHEVGIVARTYGTKSEWHETLQLLAGHVEPEDQAELLQGLYELSQADPEHRHDLNILAWFFWDLLDAHTQTPDAYKIIIMHVKSLVDETCGLDLSELAITDISVLSELPNLQSLDLRYTHVNDISVVRHLTNLWKLELDETNIDCISALSNASNLKHLNISTTSIHNITSLEKLTRLEHLDLSQTQVSDICALANLINLQYLDLCGTQVDDITALAKLRRLRRIKMNGIPINDISILSQMHCLEHLNLNGTRTQDVSCLSGLNRLQELFLLGTQVNDISSLVDLNNLTFNLRPEQLLTVQGSHLIKRLHLRFEHFKDISSLSKLTVLQRLALRGAKVSDISVLANLTDLQYLDLGATRTEDVLALANLTTLKFLSLWKTPIYDISPLVRLSNLQTLDLRYTRVRNVLALAGLTKLTKLYLEGSKVTDVSALRRALPDLEIYI
ncbi:MAG: NACHT domain-containing protein [Chloroflexota bacterium]